MSEKVSLLALRCPMCGGELKAEKENERMVCVYCDSTVVPVSEQNAKFHSRTDASSAAEKINTSSSALAYMEDLFETYDWEAFSYGYSLTLPETEALIARLKVQSADDKNTWIADFQAAYVPFSKKTDACQRFLLSAVQEYKQDGVDAYSTFDAYKRVSRQILSNKDALLTRLERDIKKAEKYGAAAAEIASMREKADGISKEAVSKIHNKLEEIPQIKAFLSERNAKCKAELAARGIDASAQYAQAKALIEQGKSVQALRLLRQLEDYEDSAALAQELNEYFLLGDALEVGTKRYCFKKYIDESGRKNYSLHPEKDGKLCTKPLLTDIHQVITNFADILYYLNYSGELIRCDLTDPQPSVMCQARFNDEQLYLYEKKNLVYLRTQGTVFDIHVLDLDAGTVKPLLKKVRKILGFYTDKLVFQAENNTDEKEESPAGCLTAPVQWVKNFFKDFFSEKSAPSEEPEVIVTKIMLLDDAHIVNLGDKPLMVQDFTEDSVIYTTNAPAHNNQNLYIKPLRREAPAVLLEENIFRFHAVTAGKLFYFVGNSKQNTTVTIAPDGSGRCEWPQRIGDIFFQKNGWIFFTRTSGHNTILCRARADGSRFKIVAKRISQVIELKNGFLYFIDDTDALVKVRMDGSNLQTLCQNVEQVLNIREEGVIFISRDDSAVKSIYAVDFTGAGLSKLAYNIKDAKARNGEWIYYIATKMVEGKKKNMLLRLNTHDGATQTLMQLSVTKEPQPVQKEEESDWFFVCVLFAGIAFFIMLVGCISGSWLLSLFCFVLAVIALAAGLFNKYKSSDTVKKIKKFLE